MIGGPTRFEPSFRAEVFWVGIFDWISEEGIVQWKESSAFGDEASVVVLVFFSFVCDSCIFVSRRNKMMTSRKKTYQ